MDRLVGLLPIHAHGAARLEPLRTDPAGRAFHRGCQGPCGHRRPARRCVRGAGTSDEAAEFRRQAKRSAATVEVSQSVSSAGKVLRQKTQVNIGGAGLPLSEMSNLAATMRETYRSHHQAKGRAERAMPLRERQEIQEMLRRLSVWESWFASLTLTPPHCRISFRSKRTQSEKN